jgi:hypothetical protein
VSTLYPQTLQDIRQQITALYRDHEELAADDEAWALSLESETDLHAVLGLLVEKMQDDACMAGAIKTRMHDLEERAERYVQREKALRKIAYHLMVEAKAKKVELPEATLSIRQGTVRTEVPDDDAVPDEFCRFKREPDKARIKEHLQACNGSPPNWAALVQSEPSLSVRTK